jgi:hypothetical protein
MWQRTWTERRKGEWTEDLDGVSWFVAGAGMHWISRRWHWPHTPQTRGVIGGLGLIERCKCGATRLDRGSWIREKTL